MSHDVFISHSSIDKTIADAVTAALEQAQIRCWIAPRDIVPGESWGGSIVDAIEASKVMVMVFSSNSNDSKQVMREVERAVQKDVIVVPFRVEAVEPSRDMEYFLSATHWLDAITPEMDQHLQELVTTVKALLNKSSGQTAARPAAAKVSPQPAVAVSGKPQRSVSKFNWQLWAALGVVTAIAVLALLMLGGDDQSSDGGKSASEKTLAKDLGEREEGSIKLKIPDEAHAAQKITVAWSGKSASNDRIVVAKPDAQDSVALQYTNAGDGDSAELQLPGEPGLYEVRYQNGANRQVMARKQIDVHVPEVVLTAESKPAPGGDLRVQWQAPNHKGDYLAVAELGSEGKSYITYSYTKAGSPTSIRVPDVPGDYELRYISALDRAVWKREKITVPEPKVSIKLAADVVAGTEVDIEWQGPGNKGDYVAVATADSESKDYINYKYAKPGQKIKLKMPEQAGEFEVRYISGLSRQIWAAQKVSVELPEVSVNPPSEVTAGNEIEIPWQGPANKGDYLTVADVGSDGKDYLSYKYVRAGQKTSLIMPDTPGEFEIRYISAQTRSIWAAKKISVTAREESLEVPASVKAGEKFRVGWQAKGHGREYVAIFKSGEEAKYITYANAKNKTAASMKAPAEPGSYEVRYISGQERQAWASAALTVK